MGHLLLLIKDRRNASSTVSAWRRVVMVTVQLASVLSLVTGVILPDDHQQGFYDSADKFNNVGGDVGFHRKNSAACAYLKYDYCLSRNEK